MTVAVLPVEGERLSQEAKRITEELRAAARVNPAFRDHGSVGFRLPEVQMSFDCFEASPDCMARVGETMNADLLIWGQISQTATAIRVQLSAVNVKLGNLYHEATFYFPDSQSVDEQAFGVTRAFLDRRPFMIAQKFSLRLETRPPGAEVTLDGNIKGKTPITLRVDEGRHRIHLTLSGYETTVRNFNPMKPMERMIIRLEPSQETLPAALRMDEPADAISGDEHAGESRWPLWTGIALGCAALVAGSVSVYYKLQSEALKDEDAAADRASPTYAADRARRIDENDSFKAMNYTFGVLGGVMAAGSLYFFFVHEHLFDETDQTKVSVGPGQVLFQTTW
ncbi:MAG: PEGA domain-containing protein [Myxococcota bacterium]|nr:PEGA domain-containing protein [Myxococcota bacterium]